MIPLSLFLSDERISAFRMGLRLRLRLLGHVLARLGPWLLGAIAYTVAATVFLRWDLTRHGLRAKDFGATLYGLYNQLLFEPVDELPSPPLSRLLFWVTPFVGILLIAEGVLKVGGALFDAEGRRQLWTRLRSEQMEDHVVVCGLGNVGFRVVQSLVDLGESVVAMERNPTGFVETIERLQIPVVRGDARRDELLVEAGVERARTIVCATDDDLANLEIAIDARRMNPKIRVVMRMFDQRMANKVGGALELDRTFSTSALAGPLIALQARWDGVRAVYRVAESLRVSVEMRVGSNCLYESVSTLEDALDLRVVALTSEGATATARGSTNLVAGSVVLLDVPAPLLGSVAKALGSSSASLK